MESAIAKFLNQDGRPDKYWKLKRMMENSAKEPPTQPEREHSLAEPPTKCTLAEPLFLDLGGM